MSLKDRLREYTKPWDTGGDGMCVGPLVSHRQYVKDAKDALSEIERLERDLAKAREDALEEAAQYFDTAPTNAPTGINWSRGHIATILRALKEKP